MEEIRNLLNQVAVISEKNNEILDATGGRFNIFKLCGVNHYETTHSAIIAELLNPQGSHGLKSKLLECFIETLKESKCFRLGSFNCENTNVRLEVVTGNGNIDILLDDGCGKCIIIENKIMANDQPEQLKRYDEYALKTYGKGNYQLMYLTLYGSEASSQSGEGIHYECISYEKDIIGWLEECVSIASRSPIVRETVIQYINHLKQLTGQGMDDKMKQDLIELITGNPQMMESADQINEIWDQCKKKIISNLAQTIKKVAEDLKLKSEWQCDSFGDKDTGILIFKENWNFHILYYFHDCHNHLLFGLDHRDYNHKCDETTVLKLKELCNNLNTNDRSWIAVSPLEAWNSSQWANWVGQKGEERLYKLIYETTKNILDRLTPIF